MSTISKEDPKNGEKDYCTICGHVLNPKSLYCIKCGAKKNSEHSSI